MGHVPVFCVSRFFQEGWNPRIPKVRVLHQKGKKVAALRRASSVGRAEIFRSWFVSSVSEVVIIGFSSLSVANALEAFRLASYRAPRAYLLPATTQTTAQTMACYDATERHEG